MEGIPGDLYIHLRDALLVCGPVATHSDLQAVFIDARLEPWRQKLPQASSVELRVNSAIEYLYTQYNDRGENALVLLLTVLRDHTSPHTSCYQTLEQLAEKLEANLRSSQTNNGEPKMNMDARKKKRLEKDKQSLLRQLDILGQNLIDLEEQILNFGIAPPIYLLRERDFAKNKIAEIEERLSHINLEI